VQTDGLVDGVDQDLRYYVGKNGYAYTKSNPHVCIHRLIAERVIGRFLRKEEVVHHKDGNPLNNRRANLVVLPNQRAHIREHAMERIRQAGGDPETQKICGTCTRVLGRLYFPRLKTSFDGLGSTCKGCANSRRRGKYKTLWTETRAEGQRQRRAAARGGARC